MKHKYSLYISHIHTVKQNKTKQRQQTKTSQTHIYIHEYNKVVYIYT